MPTLTCVTTPEADVLPASIPSEQKIASQEVVPTQTYEHAPCPTVPLLSPIVPPPYHSEHASSLPECNVPTILLCDVPTLVHAPTLTSVPTQTCEHAPFPILPPQSPTVPPTNPTKIASSQCNMQPSAPTQPGYKNE